MFNDYVYFKQIFRMYTTEDVGNKYEHLFRRKSYINYGKSEKITDFWGMEQHE